MYEAHATPCIVMSIENCSLNYTGLLLLCVVNLQEVHRTLVVV